MNRKILPIKSHETYDWLLLKHYAKRIPSISFAFGLFEDNVLEGVVTFGKPPSSSLCRGVCGNHNSEYVYELNRLCLQSNKPNQASYLVANAMKQLPQPTIVVSYADTSVNHTGYIYQACNFIYTGMSDKRTEWREKNSNRHSKTLCEQTSLEERKANPNKYEVVDRPRKHRYVYFVGNKTQKKNLINSLNYPTAPYPKGDNKRYDSGSKVSVQRNLF